MNIAQENRKKYLMPPTYEEISTFLTALGAKISQFERFFGLTQGTLKKIRKGKENLPARIWHVIYEKQVPAYSKKFATSVKPRRRKKVVVKPKQKPSAALLEKLRDLK